MIDSLRNREWTGFDSLFQALDLSEGYPEVISVVGGGGKTSLIRRLQAECRERKLCHAVSTTTHMNYVQDESFLEEESPESFFRVFRDQGTATVGHPVGADKMKGTSEIFLDELKQRGVWLLLEADGARHQPFKIPAEHEPVVRNDSTLLLAVYGLDALGKPIKECGFRPEQLAEYLQKTVEDPVEVQDYIRIATSMQGGQKAKPENCRYQVVLNKADICTDKKKVCDMALRIAECDAVEAVHITSDLWR